jgi:uncharacterized beta-barrel protein YwiB (DUF1934 family)
MRRGILSLLALALAISLVLIPNLYSQATKDKESGLDRLEGTVLSVSKDKSLILLRQPGKDMTFQLTYDQKTTFTYRNAASTLDEVKEGRRVICLGKADGLKFAATRIDVRDK